MNIFKRMYLEYAYVVKISTHVQINYDKLNEYISKIKVVKGDSWLNNIGFCLENLTKEQMINLLLIYHSIGFSYFGNPKWSVNYDSESYDGALGLLVAFVKSFEESYDMLDLDLSYDDFKMFLAGNIQIPMLYERYQNIIEIANVVCENMNGSFYDYIKDIKDDVHIFDIIIDNFKSYGDKAVYKNKQIHFYKRAQLLVSDILHYLSKYSNDINYSNLIGAADYKIPQVLRNLGILEYDDMLSYYVDNQKLIPRGSEAEVEIRASTLYVISEIASKLNNEYASFDINDTIWQEGQKNKDMKPYHRTRTTAY